ncbi:MAG: zinc-ribbon domain-containing protein [Actinobacteria bacterium]|nr:zinc-ribbon domain-containing protein [Actinomycetota bacterium]MBU4241414.1 zinc-ribbon domain-containing protein [Actinomycetota bacterium]MBU4301240.1 zinc-ribbon domain-containing protein [Actinomycetota bacterium]MBU4385961.1 zinc-ribbon domain-containing protein [Actinomycetota bacterium]MBU4489280.1 zinc-ribbon domain-containing protein [Actinomycetota bacterium]
MPPAEAARRYCKNCGAEMDPGKKFCAHCGEQK